MKTFTEKFNKFLVVNGILLLSFPLFAQYPQEKINYVYQQELNKLKNCPSYILPQGEDFIFIPHFGREKGRAILGGFRGAKGDLFIGDNEDTLIINSDTSINNNIIIISNGVVIVDSAKLTLSGWIYMIDSSRFILQNNAHLSFNQFYFNQYGLHLLNNSLFYAIDATIDGNGLSVNDIELYDSASYIARNVTFNDWSFRKLFDKSALILEDVNYVGDMLVKDSCNVTITRSDIILPWLEIPNNAIVNITFPTTNPDDTVFHFEFNESQPNVDGIGYSITIDTSTIVMWGLDVQPGSNLSVEYSVIFGFAHRFMGADTMYISGLFDSVFYDTLYMPLPDRTCQLFNSFVYSWQLYGQEDSAVLFIDSCSFGELMAKQNCDVYATRSICDGIWLHLGVTNNGFISFSDGLVKSFADTWQRSALLLTNSEIRCTSGWAPPPLGPNYAHHYSYFLAVNSAFDYTPWAYDTALVMFVYIDSLGIIDTDITNDFSVTGSAWLQAGPFNTTTFNQYKLYYQHIDSTTWEFIGGTTDTVHWDTLAIWNVSGLPNGDYILRLTLWDSENDSLSALREVTLTGTASLNNEISINPKVMIVYPNPFSETTTLEITNWENQYYELKLYDLFGREVRNYKIENKKTEISRGNLPSGMYFYKVKDNKQFISTGKLIVQ